MSNENIDKNHVPEGIESNAYLPDEDFKDKNVKIDNVYNSRDKSNDFSEVNRKDIDDYFEIRGSIEKRKETIPVAGDVEVDVDRIGVRTIESPAEAVARDIFAEFAPKFGGKLTYEMILERLTGDDSKKLDDIVLPDRTVLKIERWEYGHTSCEYRPGTEQDSDSVIKINYESEENDIGFNRMREPDMDYGPGPGPDEGKNAQPLRRLPEMPKVYEPEEDWPKKYREIPEEIPGKKRRLPELPDVDVPEYPQQTPEMF